MVVKTGFRTDFLMSLAPCQLPMIASPKLSGVRTCRGPRRRRCARPAQSLPHWPWRQPAWMRFVPASSQLLRPISGLDPGVCLAAAAHGRQSTFGDVVQFAGAVVDALSTVKLTGALGNRGLLSRRANFFSLHATDGVADHLCGVAVEAARHFAFDEAFHFRRQIHVHGHGAAFTYDCLFGMGAGIAVQAGASTRSSFARVNRVEQTGARGGAGRRSPKPERGWCHRQAKRA